MAGDLSAQPSDLRRRLGVELRHLRSLARLGGRPIGRATGLSQSSVSRVESGLRRPSRAEVDAWLDAVDADPDARERVLSLLKAVHGESLRWRDLLTDSGTVQEVIGERERAARLIREWSPDVVPGLLQTREYAEHLLPLIAAPGIDPDATLAGRLERQRILYEPGRRFVFLTTEHAMTRPVAPREVLDAQRAHLIARSMMEGVTIGVVPEPWPLIASSEFMIYEENDDDEHPFVAMELTHGQAIEVESPDYHRVFAKLEEVARPVDDV